MEGGKRAWALVCGTCGEGVAEKKDAWVADCCDTVLCFLCLYRAASRVCGEPRKREQYQCLSISCFQPLPDYVIPLAVMWQAFRSLKVTDASGSGKKIGLKAWLTRTPGETVALEVPDTLSLGQLVTRAMRRLACDVRSPIEVYLRQGAVQGEEYMLERANHHHSCRCIEVKDGDALLLDLDGLVPTQTCFACEDLVSKSAIVTFHCGHWVCRECWTSWEQKAGSGTLWCPRARCGEKVGSGKGALGVRVLVWREMEVGEVQALPHSSTAALVSEAASKAGVSTDDFAAYTHDSLNSAVLRLPLSTQEFPQSLLHNNNNILFVPKSISNKLGHTS